MTSPAPAALWMALDAIAYLDDPDSHVVDDAAREALVRDYAPEEIIALFDALGWAIENPQYPFKSAYAPLPPIRHDEQTIVRYFTIVREGMRPIVERLRPRT
jgi:hypothetical protein